MGLKSDDSSRTICKKLLLILPGFYIIYYLVSIILTAGLKNSWRDLGHVPFMIEKRRFSPAAGKAGLEPFLSMVLSYTVASALLFFIVRNTSKCWDYAVTLSTTHFVVCCIVNTSFPTNWIWWLTILLSTLWMTSLSAVSHYYLRDMQDIRLVH